ncbi:2-amino-4-hydroxy-6-hydroxymethyldihydropteridine diphosphokinase [Flocculibacter collagenilyticus]|uniref:2-amino-4-hydroxy-6- hydroxymethyldihydropteridine diphosphokinase n=1 Tax=Flocculibacter collagenilyticus TaxID=2744479 RepID=UPI0018F6DDBC|nr:2-amino-4-hydroxy-6-hydroxymethyldihydropteridine diphosphokinase [Flocculibacter collagenilyticus]
MAKIYISVGSNINKNKYIQAAIASLGEFFGPLVLSSVYESEAVGFEGENFYNMVIGADTDLSLESVAAILKTIEQQNGRERTAKKFSPRTLDLDLLTYDDVIADEPVQIPRDEITKNAFVLLPLAEVAPNELHPTDKLSFSELWQAFDKNTQQLWKVNLSISNS